MPAPHAIAPHSPTRHRSHNHYLNQNGHTPVRMATRHPIPHHLPPCLATDTTATMAAPHLIPPPSCARHLGPTNTKTETNTKVTGYIPRLGIQWDSAHHPDQTYNPPSPPFKLSQTHVLPPGQTNQPAHAVIITAVNTTTQTIPLPQHHLPALHHRLLYPIASSQPHKTTETPNDESRQSPELFRMKFLFDFIYLFTIAHINNLDQCTLLYPYIIIPPPPPPPLSFCFLLLSSLVV